MHWSTCLKYGNYIFLEDTALCGTFDLRHRCCKETTWWESCFILQWSYTVQLENEGIEPPTSRMQSERSTPELIPLFQTQRWKTERPMTTRCWRSTRMCQNFSAKSLNLRHSPDALNRNANRGRLDDSQRQTTFSTKFCAQLQWRGPHDFYRATDLVWLSAQKKSWDGVQAGLQRRTEISWIQGDVTLYIWRMRKSNPRLLAWKASALTLS